MVTVGGAFEAREEVKAELLETLHAGPGEAARREVTVGTSGPVPSRWTLRTLRVSVAWLTGYSLSGVWRVLHACGLGLHAACARLFSPDPDYRSKVRWLHRGLRDARGWRWPSTASAPLSRALIRCGRPGVSTRGRDMRLWSSISPHPDVTCPVGS